MRKIWQSILRRKRAKKISAKYLPCRIYALDGWYLWSVSHHGKIVAKGRSKSFRLAADSAGAAVFPSKIVIGAVNEYPRNR